MVSLAPSVTETLFAIGAGEEVVGVSEFCDHPPEAARLPRVGSYLRPNIETIVSLRPDAVIAVPSPGNRQAVEAIETLGHRVVVVEEGPTVDDVFGAIGRIADEAGRAEAGRALVGRLRAEIDRVRTRLAGRAPKRVLIVVGQNPLVVVGGGTLLDRVLSIAGGTNVAGDLDGWPRLSVEALIRRSPDVVLDSSMGEEGPGDASLYGELGLAAAKRGQVIALRFDEILRPGPRLGAGIDKLARRLHPEAFR